VGLNYYISLSVVLYRGLYVNVLGLMFICDLKFARCLVVMWKRGGDGV